MNVSGLPLLATLLATQLPLARQPLLAQRPPIDAYVLADTAQAYWRLQADPKHTTPTVQFFNRYHQLLYQEQLPESKPQLTRRMKRAFDVLLTNLTTNRLLAATDLAPGDGLELGEASSTSSTGLPLKQIFYRKGRALMAVQPSIDQSGNLILYAAQAKHRLIQLRLVNQDRSLTYYEDCSGLGLYRRRLDLSALSSGVYQLWIHGYARSLSYRVTIDRAVNRCYLQPETDLLSIH